jgi:hypothetical protein
MMPEADTFAVGAGAGFPAGGSAANAGAVTRANTAIALIMAQ